MLAFLVISLLSVPDPNWFFSGPIFAGTPSGDLEECYIGYGDRAVQGFHAGLDFGDPAQGSTGSMVLSPANMPWRAIGIPWADPNDPDNQIVCFGTASSDEWGWSYGHINFPNPASWYNLYASNDGTPKQELAETTNQIWRHIHVAWVPAWFVQVPPIIVSAYHNPFDWIESVPTGYQVVKFARVEWWEAALFGPNSSWRGIIVLPDENEAFLLSPASQTEEDRRRLDFQRAFRGAVDFVVNPVSAHEGLRGTCGVREIEYSVQREDNYSSGLAQVQEPRVVFNMNGELPWSDSQNDLNFKALFADETYQGGGYTIPGPFFNNYIVTNSGVSPTGDTGLENVIDHPANVYHDWQNDVFNIGGFDTSLRSTETGGSSSIPTAFVNEHAEFPDGRYWVTIAAVTQDGLGSGIATLPAVDCYADPTVRDPAGFVIDNYYPHVDSIIVYQLYPFRVRFRGGWTTPDIARPFQELREQSALSSWTYFSSGQSILGVAVKYSERLDETNLGCVWFTGGGTTAEPTFSTLELGEDGILNPTTLWRTDLGARPDSSNQYWVCYETQMNWPCYVGNIRVHIGSPDGSELPRDLAGKAIDIDPETIAYPVGMNSTDGYETGFADTLHSWGNPSFWAKPGGYPPSYYIIGYRSNYISFVTVHLEDDLGFDMTMATTQGPRNGEYNQHSICPDWGGFWLQHWDGSYKQPYVYIARPTGADEWDSFQLSIPTSDDLIWSNAVNTQSGRYLFVIYKDNYVPGVSCTGHLVCYSALPTTSGTPLGISSNQVTFRNHVPALNPQLGPTVSMALQFSPVASVEFSPPQLLTSGSSTLISPAFSFSFSL